MRLSPTENFICKTSPAISTEKTNAYLRGKYYAAATGGSSGKRGIFLWDWETFVVTANIYLP